MDGKAPNVMEVCDVFRRSLLGSCHDMLIQRAVGGAREEMLEGNYYQSADSERSEKILEDHALRHGLKRRSDRESANSAKKSSEI